MTSSRVHAQTPEYRGLWADAWGAGFRTAAEVNTLTNNLRAGNYNMIIPQVRRRGDSFYNSNFEPKNTGVAANFDPLADLIAKCHNTNFGPRIEVHAWIVTYHIWQSNVSTPLPPQPDHALNLHPDWLLRDVNGNTIINREFTFDPGHPEVQRHTFNVAMEIITNYNVDGLNFDYIRYSSANEGYNPVSVARFNQRYGRTGQPSPSDALWKQFRRDQITGLLRKVYLNAIAVKPHVKISCDTITWHPGPTSLATWYSSSGAWNSVLQDWRGWMEEGIMDLNIPMAYFNQAGAYTLAWTNWNNFTKDHQYNRHAIIGPGIYLNSVADAILQMRHTRTPSPSGNFARGSCGYSYRVTNKDSVSRATFLNALVNPSAYDPIPPPIFAQQVATPVMPWKATPTRGHLMGTVYSGTLTNGLDGAVVTLTGPVNRAQTNDATGFYGFVDLPAGNYTVAAAFPGYPSVSSNVTVTVGNVATRNLQLTLQGPPAIVAHPGSLTNYVGTPAAFAVSAAGTSPLSYQWRHNGVNLPGATNTSYTLAAITPDDAGSYVAVVSNHLGAATSSVATLTVIVPQPNQRLLPLWSLAPGSRPYLSASDGSQRGLAFNPVNGNLVLVSRPGNVAGVYVLNSTNGADRHTLNLGSGVVSGGTFALNMIGVADDGTVYAGNLSENGSTTPFRLYRWANDNPGAAPTLIFSGNPISTTAERWGDTLAVRGAGPNTQILIGTRSGTNAVIFTTSNGTSFTPQPIAVSGGGNGMFGLGIAFGAGNTFWGNSISAPLRQASFNLAAGTGSVLQTFGSPPVVASVTAIGVSTGLLMLGGVSVATPDNFQLYNLPLSGAPSLIETNAFPTDNPNSNNTGSVDFGGDRVFALNSNNGLLAMQILPPPSAPTILTNPSSQTVIEGEIAEFTVTASGTAPLAYQWRRNGITLPGETDPTLALPSAMAGDAGNYFVVVTNSLGAATSTVATLTVMVPPEITAQPQPLTVPAGQDATFSVTATGTAPLFYQWRFNEADLAGATNSTYIRSSTVTAHAGDYSVVVSNAAAAIVSDDALLTLLTPPPPADFELLQRSPDGSVQLRWEGGPLFTYTVEISSNLWFWTTLANVVSSNATFNFTDSTATNEPLRFYRVRN